MKNPLQKEFDQIDHYLAMGDLVAPSVSKRGLYWHADHCLRVLEGVPQMMSSSVKEEYSPKSSFIKTIIMSAGWMPRGKGKSPKHVLPEEDKLNLEELKIRADRAFHQVNTAATLPDWSYMKHPLFGDLKRDSAIRFLKIHTRHHLKIMRDIAKKAS